MCFLPVANVTIPESTGLMMPLVVSSQVFTATGQGCPLLLKVRLCRGGREGIESGGDGWKVNG